jgi:hypothetical protein
MGCVEWGNRCWGRGEMFIGVRDYMRSERWKDWIVELGYIMIVKRLLGVG